jgi:hypothetical protein
LWGEVRIRSARAAEGIYEVIVTGTKREQRGQEVPFAVSAITGKMPEKTFRSDDLPP